MALPLIAVTAGDPSGIGPEIAVKVTFDDADEVNGVAVVVVQADDTDLLTRFCRWLGL